MGVHVTVTAAGAPEFMLQNPCLMGVCVTVSASGIPESMFG